MSGGMENYGRTVEIITGIQDLIGYRTLHLPVTLSSDPNQPKVSATVNYALDGTPGNAAVNIYGPPPEMVKDLLSGERAFLRISAGYNGVLKEVFSGRPTKDGTKAVRLEDGGVRLTISALSGGSKYRLATVRISERYAKVRPLFERVVKEAGWQMGRNDIPEALEYPRGICWPGDASELLKRMATYAGCELLISGDVISVIDPTKDLPDGVEEVPFFSSWNRNLIGSVAHTDKGVTFSALLEDGSLRPGKQVVLGYYSIATNEPVQERGVLRDTSFHISTHEDAFRIQGVLRPVRR